eukprot:CAMPEP_0116881438 /NCGR_PEP_ID=MMETSP0463-20121206/13555_1 /TAXON_ID=181622 /ORGANISM="Strombidinopsis sp, Strain SopsisLIS2011" /LENGTH=158 /DNA_ID=CAMNT_0004533393 /DNA_START=220 /DNA_END=696 /DNA_ORIENTATION=-
MQALVQELAHRKVNVEDATYDKISMADYFSAAALTTIDIAGGPRALDEFVWGRKDATQADLGNVDNIPTENNYRSNMEAKGFTNEEIVALASVEAFSVVQDPAKVRWLSNPVISNYYYKALLTGQDDLPLQNALLNDADLKEYVDKFAEDNKEYFASF